MIFSMESHLYWWSHENFQPLSLITIVFYWDVSHVHIERWFCFKACKSISRWFSKIYFRGPLIDKICVFPRLPSILQMEICRANKLYLSDDVSLSDSNHVSSFRKSQRSSFYVEKVSYQPLCPALDHLHQCIHWKLLSQKDDTAALNSVLDSSLDTVNKEPKVGYNC